MEEGKMLLHVMEKRILYYLKSIGWKNVIKIVAVLVAGVMLTAMIRESEKKGLFESGPMVKAGNGTGLEKVQAAQTAETEELQAGLMGMVNGIKTMKEYSQSARNIDTASANEKILIGAARASRTQSRRERLEQGVKNAENVFFSAKQLILNKQMPPSEYYTLLRIVEAEATGEDFEGKRLIANVILNRVRDERFPDTIEGVVYQQEGGSAQFQPTVDGRINTVEITESTIEAVEQALNGVDESHGALFFMARCTSEDVSVDWFDDNLIRLFAHGGHEYFTLSQDAQVS